MRVYARSLKSLMVHKTIALKLKYCSPMDYDMSTTSTSTHNFFNLYTIGWRYSSIVSSVGEFGPGIIIERHIKNHFVSNHGGKLYTTIMSGHIECLKLGRLCGFTPSIAKQSQRFRASLANLRNSISMNLHVLLSTTNFMHILVDQCIYLANFGHQNILYRAFKLKKNTKGLK
jgi:hypothetical protein